MIPFIGGKCDGMESPAKLPQVTEDGEAYILMETREKGQKPEFFYMVAGSKPAEAVKIYRDRQKTAAGIWGK